MMIEIEQISVMNVVISSDFGLVIKRNNKRKEEIVNKINPIIFIEIQLEKINIGKTNKNIKIENVDFYKIYVYLYALF